MVGRVRVEKGDKITLYIKRFDEKYVEHKIRTLEKKTEAYYDYDLAYNAPENENYKKGNAEHKFFDKYYRSDLKDWENAKHWFGLNKKSSSMFNQNDIYLNEISRSLTEKLLPKYKETLAEMQRTDTGESVTGQKYLEQQLSWFGKPYDIGNDITLSDKDKGKNDLINFLDSYANNATRMFDEDNEQQKFSEIFTQLYDKSFPREDKNKGRNYGINKMNKIIEKQGIGYRIESKEDPENKKTYWLIVKQNCEQESI